MFAFVFWRVGVARRTRQLVGTYCGVKLLTGCYGEVFEGGIFLFGLGFVAVQNDVGVGSQRQRDGQGSDEVSQAEIECHDESSM